MKISVPISTLLHQKGSTVWHVPPETTVFEAIKLMAAKNIGSLLVMSGAMLVGIFTERDYTRKIALQGKTSKETQVWEIMPKEVYFIRPTDSAESCMKLMTEHRVRHLPVVENGKVLGVISIGDLVNWIISAQDATIAQMEQYISGSLSA
jgi:CBS domain-containing protein